MPGSGPPVPLARGCCTLPARAGPSPSRCAIINPGPAPALVLAWSGGSLGSRGGCREGAGAVGVLRWGGGGGCACPIHPCLKPAGPGGQPRTRGGGCDWGYVCVGGVSGCQCWGVYVCVAGCEGVSARMNVRLRGGLKAGACAHARVLRAPTGLRHAPPPGAPPAPGCQWKSAGLPGGHHRDEAAARRRAGPVVTRRGGPSSRGLHTAQNGSAATLRGSTRLLRLACIRTPPEVM